MIDASSFTEALFVMAKDQKEPKCLSTGRELVK